MDPLQQYLELFRVNRNMIDRGSAPVLNAMRDQAFRSLESKGIPRFGSEIYTYTDLQEILSPDYGLNLARVKIDMNPQEAFRCAVPGMDTSIFMLLGDLPASTPKSLDGIPEGVTIDSLRKAAIEKPDLISPYYGQIASLDNPIVALNTIFAQDGLVIHIPRGVKVEKPIQLINLLEGMAPMMAVRRILVIADPGSSVRLLACDHTRNSDVAMLALQVIEIHAAQDATVDFYDLEESGLNTRRLSSLWLDQHAGSNVLINGITLYNGTTRNEYFCTFRGENAELHLLGMAVEDRNRHADTYSVVRHDVGHCHTDELFKYVVDDEALGAFSGLVYVAPGASKTEAYQSNRNLVSTSKAIMHSKPQLEIYNDDVKCSHGTAIGQLDEMQLFYMRTRGLDEAQARLLLKQAFMADVIDGVRLPALRDRLHVLVENRFSGVQSRCSSCSAECIK